jgi:hypothetical protein
MQLLDAQVNAEFLAELGVDAVQLLCSGDFDTLASRYGYALSFGREAATAIREDLKRHLSEIGAAKLVSARELEQPNVVFYKPNSSNLVAAVELLAPADNAAALQVALVVTTDGTAQYITLEGLAAFTAKG